MNKLEEVLIFDYTFSGLACSAAEFRKPFQIVQRALNIAFNPGCPCAVIQTLLFLTVPEKTLVLLIYLGQESSSLRVIRTNLQNFVQNVPRIRECDLLEVFARRPQQFSRLLVVKSYFDLRLERTCIGIVGIDL